MTIIPMTPEYAQQVSTWKYGAGYSFYDRDRWGFDAYLDEYHFACVDSTGVLHAYYCFGCGAQIPTVEGNAYEEDYLDIGLYLRPDLCGKGLGRGYLEIGLQFAQITYKTDRFRLTVASFNERAIKAYSRAGFQPLREVTNSYFLNEFVIMTYIL